MDFTTLTDDQIILTYRKLREQRDEAKAEFTESQKPTLEAMQKLENEANRRMIERESTSFSTGSGMAYTKDDSSVTSKNKTAFFDWLVETGNWECADVRPAKVAVMEYAKQKETPPGINISIRKKVLFNAPRNK